MCFHKEICSKFISIAILSSPVSRGVKLCILKQKCCYQSNFERSMIDDSEEIVLHTETSTRRKIGVRIYKRVSFVENVRVVRFCIVWKDANRHPVSLPRPLFLKSSPPRLAVSVQSLNAHKPLRKIAVIDS